MANDKSSDLVEAALNKVLKDIEDHEEGDMLIDWVMVCYVTNVDKEKTSGYPMLFSNGDMPAYRARGLLTTALLKLEDL